MKSIIARLEALEAWSHQSIVLIVTFKDGSTKEMGVAEFRELPKEQLSNRDAVRIVSGDDLKEFDEYIDTIVGMFADIVRQQVENRNIEDFK